MEETPNKTKLKINACTYRRLSIEHEMNENIRKKNHLSKLHYYKHREDLFNKKIDSLRRNFEHIEPHVSDDTDDGETLMTPNCFARIQNHFRLLNFSTESEKRLLCQAPAYNKSSKQISNELPTILQKRNSTGIDQCVRHASFYQSRTSVNYSCRTTLNSRFSSPESVQQKALNSFVNHQLVDEQNKQMKNNERKTFLLREFDELKHTIDDPHSTLSVLSALSRALLFLDSGIK
ncbi:unnamed protein product [Rotaria magnacalcarata]|uniref:Uncharacterized protein n=2 Tax=Rotaria magnacalcarata TaxID=392030 RepID=A0A816PX44_9BILA|nr:unnamed protein product [Rotaria magnacalcarata]CAF1490157.1 unnamed protein product [Rotaria magnacalcarata]CAF2050873.1 unnamed protein product [Rotaria magnacalcarata]CAF2053394.1 unnamed protein product [Rotaria magnacalcarata]CAF2237656.1 unnamed protein product [Rotaria magnacalcarata]